MKKAANYAWSLVSGEGLTQLVKVGIIGVFNTVVHFTISNVLKFGYGWSDFWAVTVAFSTATAGSYFLNRRWTFAIKHGKGLLRETLVFYTVNLIAWAVTVSVVELADRLIGPLDGWTFNLAQMAAVGIVLLPKFASYRDLVFAKSRKEAGHRVLVGKHRTD